MSQQESLQELMAQFRQLENSDSVPTNVPEKQSSFQSNYTSNSPSLFPNLSLKNTSSWYPLLILLGGLLLFSIIMVAVFRPSFLYSQEQAFLWKRYFITVFATFILLVLTLYGLKIYIARFF